MHWIIYGKINNNNGGFFNFKAFKSKGHMLIPGKFRQFLFIDWAIVSCVKFYSSSKNRQMLRMSEQEQ